MDVASSLLDARRVYGLVTAMILNVRATVVVMQHF